MNLVHHNDNKLKIQFTILFESLEGLTQESEGVAFLVDCKQGIKGTGQKTQQAIAKNKSVTWKEPLVFTATFYQNKNTKKLTEKKELAIHVKEIKPQKEKKEKDKKKDKEKEKEKEKTSTFAEGKLNLGLYSEPGKVCEEKLILKAKSKISPVLNIKIETKWLKMNNKTLVKVHDSRKGDVKLGGEEFHLEDASEITESTAASDEETEDLEDFEDENTNSSVLKTKSGNEKSSSHNNVSTENKDKRRETGSSFSVVAPTQSNDLMKQELEDLKRDKSRLEKKVENLTKEKEELKHFKLELEKNAYSKEETSKISLKSQEESNLNLITELREKNAKLSEKVTKYKAQNKELTEKLETIEKQLIQVKSELDISNQTKIQMMQQEAEKYKSLEQEFLQLKKTEARSNEALLSKADASQELQDEIKRRTETLNKTKEDLSKTKDQLAQKEIELTKIKEELSKSKEQITLIQSLEQESKNSITAIKEKSKKQKQELDQLQSNFEKEKQKSLKLEIEINNYKEREKQLQVDLQNEKEKGQKLQAQIDQLKEGKKLDSNTRVAETEKKLEALQKERDVIQSQLNKKKEENEKLLSEIEKSKFNQVQLIEELKVKHTEEMEELKKKQEGLHSKKLKEDDEQLKKNQQNLQSKELESLKKKISILQKENRELRLIGTAIYGDKKDDNNVPSGVKQIIESLLSWNSFDPFDSELFILIVSSLRKAVIKSTGDNQMLFYWFSFVRALFQSLLKEMPSSLEIDRNLFAKEDLLSLSESELVSKNVPFKILYELCLLAFDIYELLLMNILGQLEGTVISLLPKQNLILSLNQSNKKPKNGEFFNTLSEILTNIRNGHLPEFVISRILHQILYFADAQAFNMLLSQTSQTCGTGFQLKMSLSNFESTFLKHDKKLQTMVTESFSHIKEISNLLVMDKAIATDKSVFPHLNSKQIKMILDHFKPDEFSSEPVSVAVLQALETEIKNNPNLISQLDPIAISKTNLLSDLV